MNSERISKPMKKILCLALALLMCATLFAGCGKYDMEKADLASFVTLGNIKEFSYKDLAKHYDAYRVELGKQTSNFYMSTGYIIGFAVKAEIVGTDGALTPYAAWTVDNVENYEMYREAGNAVFDKGITYQLEDASKSTKTPRLIYKNEAFSFTMPIPAGNEQTDVAGKTVKFTVTVKDVLPSVYNDAYITEDLSNFYTTYAKSKDTVEMGDSVQFDFDALTSDGSSFIGGNGEDFVIVVGNGEFPEGFEEALVGQKKGTSFEITLTLPADYEDATAAGQEVTYKVKIDDISNDSAIISDNTPFENIWQLKEHYRIMHYIDFAIVDFVADNSTLVSLPEKLVKNFEEIYEDYVEREITDAVVSYGEQGETFTKSEMKEKLYPNGSDKTYVREKAEDAAYNYILVHLIAKELGMEYTEERYQKDVKKLAADYTSYYGTTYTVKDVEKRMGEEVLRLSFMDAMIAEKLVERVVDVPEFRVVEENK